MPGEAVRIDAVVVSYNSSATLRACVESLLAAGPVRVVVVDNDSKDGSLASLDGLPVELLPQSTNRGFGQGCNAGWRSGNAQYVLFLNPDATLQPASLARLVAVLDGDSSVGLAAPRILGADGGLEFSLRRYPTGRSALAQALFLHRLFPLAGWSDQLIRDRRVYDAPASPDWVSGACMLVRRAVLEELDGFDEGFFLYGEDIDLCRRVRNRGYDVRFEPSATVTHIGGVSAPRGDLLPVLAASRLRYARKHKSRGQALIIRFGVCLSALTHVIFGRGGSTMRRGHARALARALSPRGGRGGTPASHVRALGES